MKAIQAWRWLQQGSARVEQSYLVRVPQDQLETELARLTEERLPGLPRPNIVDIPDPEMRGRFTIVVKGYDEEGNWTLYDPQGNEVEFEVVSYWDWNKRNEAKTQVCSICGTPVRLNGRKELLHVNYMEHAHDHAAVL